MADSIFRYFTVSPQFKRRLAMSSHQPHGRTVTCLLRHFSFTSASVITLGQRGVIHAHSVELVLNCLPTQGSDTNVFTFSEWYFNKRAR